MSLHTDYKALGRRQTCIRQLTRIDGEVIQVHERIDRYRASINEEGDRLNDYLNDILLLRKRRDPSLITLEEAAARLKEKITINRGKLAESKAHLRRLQNERREWTQEQIEIEDRLKRSGVKF